MKKIVAYAAALGLAMSVNLAVPQAAHAEKGLPGRPNCRLLVETQTPLFPGAAPFATVGDCVTLFNHQGDKHFDCDVIFQVPGLAEFLGFKNYGECVSSAN